MIYIIFLKVINDGLCDFKDIMYILVLDLKVLIIYIYIILCIYKYLLY